MLDLSDTEASMRRIAEYPANEVFSCRCIEDMTNCCTLFKCCRIASYIADCGNRFVDFPRDGRKGEACVSQCMDCDSLFICGYRRTMERRRRDRLFLLLWRFWDYLRSSAWLDM